MDGPKTVYWIQDTHMVQEGYTMIGIGRKVPSETTIDRCYRNRVYTVIV
jgi:hypothetical protein